MMNLIPLLALFLSSEAQAEDSPWMLEPRVRFVVGGESWKDTNIAQIYKSTHLFPVLGIGVRFHENFILDVDSSLYRLEGNLGLTELQIQPLYTGGAFLIQRGNVESYLGAGANFVRWVETTPDSSLQGTKLGTEVRGGFRIGTKYFSGFAYPEEKYGPNPRSEVGVSGLDIEIGFAQRIHRFGDQPGFDMGAFRLIWGLQLKL
jgi:hypothetical protein